jgi:hypothetical protein
MSRNGINPFDEEESDAIAPYIIEHHGDVRAAAAAMAADEDAALDEELAAWGIDPGSPLAQEISALAVQTGGDVDAAVARWNQEHQE